MANIEERMAMIEKAVLAEAQRESEGIRSQTDEYRKRELDKVEDKILGELYGKIQQEVSHLHSVNTTDISHHETEHRHALLHRREELTEELFETVAKRLCDYAQTEQYRKQLLESAREMADNFPLHGGKLMISSKDGTLLGDLQEIVGQGCTVTPDSSIKLGGLRLENIEAGIVVDETLDTKLEEQRPWFYSHSGLSFE